MVRGMADAIRRLHELEPFLRPLRIKCEDGREISPLNLALQGGTL